MKKLFSVLTMLILTLAAFSQAPQQFNFQGVARNAQGNALVNKNISLRISIITSINSRVPEYSETRNVTTNVVGLFNVVIGSAGANNVVGSMAGITWSTGNKFLLLEIDPQGGSNFIEIGTTQLQSVPYALNAYTASPTGTASGDLAGSYPNPSIAVNAITTQKIKDASVTDAKIVTVSGIKITGNITGNANNVTGVVAIVNGGTGATTVADAKTNFQLDKVDNTSDVNKPISNAQQAAINLKVNIADTAAMLNRYAATQRILDSLALVQTRLNLKLNIADTAAMLAPYANSASVNAAIAQKLNISDTAAMLAPYANTANMNAADALKLNISDTAAMLAPYANSATVNAAIDTKLNIADTAAMLAPYASTATMTAADALKLNISDTAAMLAPYANSATVNAAIDTKLNIADTAAMLAPYASTATMTAADALKLNISDTAAMLAPYANSATVNAAIDTKLNISDTAAMLAPYANTATMTAADALKLNISDTAAMLAPYANTATVNAAIDTKLNIADTAAMLAPYANSTTVNAAIDTKLNIADTAAMLAHYANSATVNAAIDTKLNIADTAAMLAPYANTATVNAAIDTKLNIADTAAMLAPYANTATMNAVDALKLNISDTAAMLAPYANTATVNAAIDTKLNIADTAAMLAPYASTATMTAADALKLNISDTAAMLAPYANSATVNAAIDTKLNIADTAAMLAPYAASISNIGNNYLPLTGGTLTGNLTTPFTNIQGNLLVSSSNQTGGGIILSDDGDFVDMNDGYGTMRFSSGIRINSAKSGGTPVISLNSNGQVLANSFVKDGGNGNQFLKADGSVDDNTYLTTSDANAKLNISDTAAMLAPYANTATMNAVDALKLNISDTAAMLAPYANSATVNTAIDTKLNIADTAAMLAPYANTATVNAAIDTKLNIADTASMLAPYANTATVNTAIDTKLNIADTAAMLAPYAASISNIENNYLPLSGGTLTGNLTTPFTNIQGNLLVSSSNQTGGGIILSDDGDFVDMNDGYGTMRFSSGIRINSAKSGGTPVISLNSNGQINANSFVKDGGNGNQFLKADGSVDDNTYLTTSDANAKLNIADTAAMLAPYANTASVNAAVDTKLNIADTAAMLAPYAASIANVENNYLPLAGGTLTGTLTGTTANFGSDLTVNGVIVGRGQGSNTDLNTALGNGALQSNTTGFRNTAIGQNALVANTDGSWNTAVGLGSLGDYVGSYNTAIGAAADIGNDGITNSTAIGYLSSVNTSNTIQLGNGAITDVKTTGTVTANGYKIPSGTSNLYLMADGSTSTGALPVREVADEFTATTTQTDFTLTQAPSTNSKVKMFINGIRISNTAYSVSSTTLTYNPANNGAYALTASDRIQFDYYY